ncbi:hypothetical protein FOMPIDRAFT_1057277 [Fomitopsis schrenkii]|uniref:Uncharacterized protein n=1 Tax=Fomitopsis schrenkii TaxID=2126942 RepID=S8FWP2_FOMSC|nr:hypothetical protein FOMPIDRAFT_1057277 [Fomitopsis schrenkii]
MSRRAPTPLRSAPSSGPMDAMVKNMQDQIDDLVAKNRTLDHTVSKLREAVAEEQKRGSDGVDALQKTFKQERAAWIRGCDAIQAVHRLAHARTLVELDRERMAILREREAARIERLARLQRDFRLVEFQRREFDLEKRVVELERELEDQQRAYEEENMYLGEELDGQRATLAAQLQDTANELAAAVQAKEDAEQALSKLRVEHNSLVTSTSGSATELERTSLHLEGLKSSYAELEKKHAESELTIADLRRQLEKWRTLESREGSEMDTLRRSRIELEVRVKELEGRVEELEEEAAGKDEYVEKQKAKVTKYKTTFEEYKTSFEEFRKALDEARADADKAEKDAAEMRERLEEAEAALALRATSEEKQVKKSPASTPPKPPSISDHDPGDNEADESAPSASPPPQKSRGRPRKVAAPQPVDNPEEEVIAETQPQPQEVRKKRGRPRKKPFEEGNGDTAPAKPTAGTKGKRKAQDGDDSDDEPPPKKSKRKAKDKDEGDEEEPPKAKVKAKKPAVAASEGWKAADGKPKVGRKPSTSSAAAAAAVDEDDGESVPTPSKKKRKIKLFPSSQPVSFDWNQLGQSGGGLDIPTRLSPVKETESVPQSVDMGKARREGDLVDLRIRRVIYPSPRQALHTRPLVQSLPAMAVPVLIFAIAVSTLWILNAITSNTDANRMIYEELKNLQRSLEPKALLAPAPPQSDQPPAAPPAASPGSFLRPSIDGWFRSSQEPHTHIICGLLVICVFVVSCILVVCLPRNLERRAEENSAPREEDRAVLRQIYSQIPQEDDDTQASEGSEAREPAEVAMQWEREPGAAREYRYAFAPAEVELGNAQVAKPEERAVAEGDALGQPQGAGGSVLEGPQDAEEPYEDEEGTRDRDTVHAPPDAWVSYAVDVPPVVQ